jgi:hypothetical protein
MKGLSILLRLAADPEYAARVPDRFVKAAGLATMGLSKADYRFAWRLFVKERRPVTEQEIREYIAARKKRVVNTEEIDASKVGCVKSHFLDSGSFTLWTEAKEYAKEHKTDEWAFYDTPAFYEYMDGYAAFVKKHQEAIDYYANVDAIPNPELTWRNQQYLENTHGLVPVPVVHYRTEMKWLERYVDAGHGFIALGGLVGSTDQAECRAWLDRCFQIICDTKDRLPRVKVHGFGVTVHELLLRYPWYSVDSTSWTQVGAYGGILVPKRKGGTWDFLAPPMNLKVSHDSPDKLIKGKHAATLLVGEKQVLRDWLAEINVPFGKVDRDGTVVEPGVLTTHSYRKVANLLYYERLCQALPAYPWPYRTVSRRALF